MGGPALEVIWALETAAPTPPVQPGPCGHIAIIHVADLIRCRMRFAIAAAVLCFSAPAAATGGFVCSPADGKGPAISLVIGHGIPGGVIGAAVREGGRWRSTMQPGEGLVVDQSWIDRERTWVDLVHPETGAPEARLRVRNQGFGGTGTLVWKGRTYQVRCFED